MVDLFYYYFLFFYFCEIRVPALSFSQQFDNFICFSIDIQYFLHLFILFPSCNLSSHKERFIDYFYII